MAVAETPPLTIDFQAIPGCTDRSLTHLEGSCGSARVTGSGSLKRIQRWWGPSDPLPSEVSFADWGPVPARAGSGGSFEGRTLPVSVFRVLFPERGNPNAVRRQRFTAIFSLRAVWNRWWKPIGSSVRFS